MGVSRIKKIYFIYSKRLGNRKRLTLCNAYIIPNSKYRQIFVQHYCDSLVTIVLYKRSLKKTPSGTGTEWLLKIQCTKKNSQSCIYIEISALLVRLIVNIMEEIEKKNLSKNMTIPFENKRCFVL